MVGAEDHWHTLHSAPHLATAVCDDADQAQAGTAAEIAFTITHATPGDAGMAAGLADRLTGNAKGRPFVKSRGRQQHPACHIAALGIVHLHRLVGNRQQTFAFNQRRLMRA